MPPSQISAQLRGTPESWEPWPHRMHPAPQPHPWRWKKMGPAGTWSPGASPDASPPPSPRRRQNTRIAESAQPGLECLLTSVRASSQALRFAVPQGGPRAPTSRGCCRTDREVTVTQRGANPLSAQPRGGRTAQARGAGSAQDQPPASRNRRSQGRWVPPESGPGPCSRELPSRAGRGCGGASHMCSGAGGTPDAPNCWSHPFLLPLSTPTHTPDRTALLQRGWR